MSYDSSLEADNYFKELAQNKKNIKNAWDFISRTINKALSCQNIDLLLSLIPYIEEGDGTHAYKHIGESRRVLRILHIIELEVKYGKIPFSHYCHTMQELLEKYLLTLFAFRRLQFRPSEAAVSEAVYYLSQNNLSVFAVFVITKQDLIIPDETLYEEIIRIHAKSWTASDRELLTSLITN